MKTKSIDGKTEQRGADTASALIDAHIAQVGGWRGEMLAGVRELIRQALPDVVEEVKWRKPSNPAGVPVWARDGIICTGETYKDKIKLTFPKGAQLADPQGLFNASMEGNARRAIDLYQDEKLDATAFKDLIRTAAASNKPR
ncbi:DUF1801 domain-containing protein [Solilutibacter tolerans]|uniref:YdhG-like domain-containing protein n=1 Tax=Solilutibacter tolerans TaxID=1604334 RepID=A0A1N6XD54_9GAMM|nr:DUF1801 domain-containing protein [Lysobacter tolerans]SIR00282.1 hypothetical protein SAMN05421546_2204 [Lysobacter tolerans]